LADFTGASDFWAGLAAGDGLVDGTAALGAGFFGAGLAAGLLGDGFFFGTDFFEMGFDALTGFFGVCFAAGLTDLPTDFFLGTGTGFLVFLAMVVWDDEEKYYGTVRAAAQRGQTSP
jgi:hypothetical protein